MLLESSVPKTCHSSGKTPHHTLVAETIETISDSSSGDPQLTVAETADSNIGSQKNSMNFHDTPLQQSVPDEEELLIPLTKIKSGNEIEVN